MTPAGPTRVCRQALTAAAMIALLAWPAPAPGDSPQWGWPTHRGSPRRSGNLDGKPGPTKPKVLWAYKAPEHFIASPVPGDKTVYVSGLGAFNTGVFHCLAVAADAPKRLLWSKTAPYLKRPTVCSPAVADGFVVFGDGMHQTDGAILYCLQAASGRPVWQLPMPGKDIRIECSPTIDAGRVFFGAGGGGVLGVDLKRVTLDGKDQDFAAVTDLIAKRWAELLAKYEQDRKKDPTFAVPPSEDALPKPAPKVLWRQGQAKWYVGAPVAVSADRVLVASEYLDDEKIGRRSVFCLKAGDGSVVWEAPVKVNPWAGPTIAGNLVLVGCSSIRYDVGQIAQATGAVVAIDLTGGQVRWEKAVPGGVLSPIAVAGDLAVFAATDGKLRAWEAATGKTRWVYDGGKPFFAGVAVAGGVVYAADLKAVLHAVGLTDGKRKWVLDVPADPATQAPGMAFASPVVHDGDVYLATCNLGARTADQPGMVVCVSDKAPAPPAEAAAITVDQARRTVTISCRVAPRKLPSLKEVYPIEVIASHPHPRGQKAHETVVTFEAKPSDVHKALVDLGLRPGRPAKGAAGAAAGPEVTILLELPALHGQRRVIPVEHALLDRRTGKSMPALRWHFTGSALKQPDPDKPDRVYGADLSGTLIAVFPVTDETVFQSNLTMAEEMLLKLETNRDVLGAEGTPATLIIRAAAAASPGRGAPALAPDALAPFVTGPRRWPAPGPAATLGGWWLPPARLGRQPALLPSERQHPLGPRPEARGPPRVAALRRPPPRPLLPAPPPPRFASPDADRVALLPIPDRFDPDGIALDGDPTSAPARRALLATVPAFRRGPAPFLKLAIPDPFEGISAVRLRSDPPDDDPPATEAGLPPRPTLPTKP